MATISEQPKPPAAQDHQYPPGVVPYPQPYSPPFPPPPPGYPPFFAYPPPADAAHAENGQAQGPPAPYMMAFAPGGMVYAYPTPQGAAFPPPASSVPPALAKPKRKQVKMACTNCAAACKRCDESRPCERCIKYGMSNTCVDGQRKERKKGIKRGPYKRKNKNSDTQGSYPPEWPAAGQPPPPTVPPAAIPVPHQFPPEGFYPVYYGPPDGQQTNPDGSPAQPPPPPPPLPHHPPPHVGVNGQPAMLPPYFYAAYPPFSHYPPMFPPPGLPPPPPGTQPPPQQPPTHAGEQPPTASPSAGHVADAAKKNGEVGNQTPPMSTASATSVGGEGISLNAGDGGVAAAINASINTGFGTKKRMRGAKAANGANGEPRTKRTKVTRAAVKDVGVRPAEVEGVGGGEKDADAEGEVVDENGSGNESSA
ncbi:hypothetical protein P691DRAFT_844052 [Macrolepiota fuliginosa MF-IS2]|uniref:Zn(2)-C6 fungal-type domain-containing protein n=1 Tax=Macrolepiota fuliginosa MF-IS2 TaxID=1400762 RepID=A0A9P5X490_9AGAR|nr:hypothetical protein P691DRAFT_844052 [Macrolepiota fuliginosa MF-IS2]